MQNCLTDQMPPGFWKENRYEIISTIAYLIGVPVRIFENDHEPPRIDIFRRLEYDKNARIVRNLCCIRTAIERNYKKINTAIQFDFKTLNSLPEYIPQECLRQLSDDGVSFIKKNSSKLFHHVIEINKILSDRINNCRNLFPDWMNWQYVRDLFVMQDGLTEEGSKTAVNIYYANLSLYPYQMYINWKPVDEGNILFSDKKFVKILYKQHGEIFDEDSRVSDASGYVKNAIYDYIDESIKSLVVVDCENSDPYKLCAALNSLDSDEIEKISKIILFNDIHTVAAWQILESYTDIPVEHMMIERVKSDKSLVDPKLIVRTCQEHYQNHVDSFIIVASDSDYWGLISSVPTARFLVMLESEKTGRDIKEIYDEHEIFYCYLDDFYTGNAEDIRQSALFTSLNRSLAECIRLNINTLMDDAIRDTRIQMTPAEREQFMRKYIKPMQLEIEENGDVSIRIRMK